MYQLFIGVDVSKDWIDAAIWNDGSTSILGNYSNCPGGFKKLIKAIVSRSDLDQSKWFICFENTGSYSKGLLYWLLQKSIPCKEENAIQISRSKGLVRGKDDKIDSHSICMYAYRHKDVLRPTPLPDQSIVQLKKLLSRRTFLVRQRASLKTSLKDQSQEFTADFFETLKTQNSELIELYTGQIKALEEFIDELIKRDDQLQQNCSLVRSVIGIGPIIAWHMIAYTNNFKSFDNSRQFACYCGVAPFPHRSGKSYNARDRVHYLANKQIKALLSNGANTAVLADPELKKYYQKKREEGKSYGTALNAVKNKLIARAFAVVKRQSPFVPMMKYAS